MPYSKKELDKIAEHWQEAFKKAGGELVNPKFDPWPEKKKVKFLGAADQELIHKTNAILSAAKASLGDWEGPLKSALDHDDLSIAKPKEKDLTFLNSGGIMPTKKSNDGANMKQVQTYDFLHQIGIAPGLISELSKYHIKLNLALNSLSFSKASGSELVTVNLAKNTSDLIKGLVGPSLLKQIKGQIEHAIKHALTKNAVDYPPGEGMTAADGAIAAGLVKVGDLEATVKAMDMAVMQQALDDVIAHGPSTKVLEQVKESMTIHDVKIPLSSIIAPMGPVDVKKATHGAPIALKDADSMYCAVRGTSTHSIYFVVAMTDMYNVAARITPGQVSIRVEGNVPDSHVKAWESMGVSKKAGYLSGHFELGGVPPQRVLGAVLVGVGLEFKTILPNVKLIEGLGK